MASLVSLRRRTRALQRAIPEGPSARRIYITMVSRPEPEGPLKLERMHVLYFPSNGGDAQCISDPNSDNAGADDFILGRPFLLTPEQRAAWRSHEEVERFPRTPEEIALWRAVEERIARLISRIEADT